jgi:hypothetical protein
MTTTTAKYPLAKRGVAKHPPTKRGAAKHPRDNDLCNPDEVDDKKRREAQK